MRRLFGRLSGTTKCDRGPFFPITEPNKSSSLVKWTALTVRPVTRVFTRAASPGAVPPEFLQTQKAVFEPHPAPPYALEQPNSDVHAGTNRLYVEPKRVDGIRRPSFHLQPEGMLSFLICSGRDDVPHHFEEEEFGSQLRNQLAKLFKQRVLWAVGSAFRVKSSRPVS